MKFQLHTILVFGFMTLASCKKLIEVPANPSDKISTEQAFSDSSNVLNVLSGIYSNFIIVDNGSSASFFNGGVGVYTGLSGDELINRDIMLLPYQTPFYINSLTPADGYLSYMWIEAYKAIYTVNASLQGVEESQGLSSSFKQKVSGELRTIRAWCYFNLVNMFGGVPIIKETDFKVTSLQPKETQEKVFEFIIDDLEEAENSLAAEYPSAGRYRPNLYTAKAILAKAALYTGDWQKAESNSAAIIDAGIYSLEADLNNVFLKNSTEAIWQYPSEGAGSLQTNEAYVFMPDQFDPEGVPKFEITPSLFESFEENDVRKENWTAPQDVNGTIYNYPTKYKNIDQDLAVTQEDYVFFRLAEQYLIRAEARTQLDEFDDALEDVNVIRRRAELADLEFSDKETLLDDILTERRHELFCEWGNRWFDIKRLNKAEEILGSKPNWQATDVLYPIPLGELQRNPFLTQNPGY